MKTVLVSRAVETLRRLYPQAGYDLTLDSGTSDPAALADRIMGIV